MTIQQISVFLENKFGRLNEILSLISQEEVRIITATVADTSEFGILRIITNEPHKAFQALKNHRISVNLSEVFAIITPAKVGQFADTIAYFTEAGITIEYMYCFSRKDIGVIILRTNNTEATREVIRRKELKYITETGLIDF